MGFSKQEYWSGVPLPSPLITLSLLQNVQGLWRAPSALLFEEEYWGAGVGAERLIFMFLAFAFSPKDAQKPPLSSKNVLGASLFQRFPLKIDNWERIQNNDSKDDQKPWKQMEKMQESINKDLEKLSTLAWKVTWMEEPGRLQSMGSLRVQHNWATSLSLFTFMHWRMKWQPTPVLLPGESEGRGSLVGCRLWGHTESETTEVT